MFRFYHTNLLIHTIKINDTALSYQLNNYWLV